MYFKLKKKLNYDIFVDPNILGASYIKIYESTEFSFSLTMLTYNNSQINMIKPTFITYFKFCLIRGIQVSDWVKYKVINMKQIVTYYYWRIDMK